MAYINQLSEFHAYFSGVMRRARCHAPNVEEVLPLLAGIVLEHVGMIGGLQVRTHKGDYANVAWVNHNGNRYAFTYDHKTEEIILKENTLRGKELETFSNGDNYSSVTKKVQGGIT